MFNYVHLEARLAKLKEGEYAYIETGKYKPYSESTIRAIKRRGYVVEFKQQGVYYYIYSKKANNV